tara:strand:+ start:316 stop:630 length:315 start_codon:yes stop_codon:yes gene_type:complete
VLGARKRARRRGDARRADEICRERVFVVLVRANAEARRERARDEHGRQGDAATIAAAAAARRRIASLSPCGSDVDERDVPRRGRRRRVRGGLHARASNDAADDV